MQHNFEGALSLSESQTAIPAEAILAIGSLCENVHASENRESKLDPKGSKGEKSNSTSSHSSDVEDERSESQSTAQRKFKPPSSKRQQLTSVEAAEIFELRPRHGKNKGPRRGSMLICKKIAPKYGVSPKTIRDIWRGRTWLHATEHLWTEDEKKQKLTQCAPTDSIASHAADAQCSREHCTDSVKADPLLSAHPTPFHNGPWPSANAQRANFADNRLLFGAAPPAFFATSFCSPPAFNTACAPPLPAWSGFGGLRLPPAPPAARAPPPQ